MIQKLGVREIRKINYTRTVSLPKVWLNTVGLDAGDRIELEMLEDGSLVLRPQRREEDGKAPQGDDKAFQQAIQKATTEGAGAEGALILVPEREASAGAGG